MIMDLHRWGCYRFEMAEIICFSSHGAVPSLSNHLVRGNRYENLDNLDKAKHKKREETDPPRLQLKGSFLARGDPGVGP